jgi:hypothetical protein
MAYEPTNWKSGDIVTSAKLNKLEQGVANVVLIAHVDNGNTLDKTWQEIHDATLALILDSNGNIIGNVAQTYYVEELAMPYCVSVAPIGTGSVTEYNASSADGYPMMDID